MATLPKPQYPSPSAQPGVWPASRIQLRPGKAQAVSASSTLLGLQAQTPALPSEPSATEPGVVAILSCWEKKAEEVAIGLAQWWLGSDFRWCQVPILVLALGVWAITARSAWRSQESATPLLLEKISQMHQARARAVAVTLSAPQAPPAASVAGASPAARPAPATTGPALPVEEISGRADQASNNMAKLLAASIRSWFSSDPAPAEKVEGNPRMRVWVDLKTGLYYCRGTRYYGYGGRERGKVMSQKDAEYEYFQPATGAPCQ